MHAFRAIGDVEAESDDGFRAWLFRTARNVLFECGRRASAAKRARDREVELPSSVSGGLGLAAPETGAVNRLRREERLQRLECALATLSPEHREVIVLARIEGLPLTEIAERLGSNARAVSALLLRALRKLRRAFGETESLRLPLRGIVLPEETGHRPIVEP